MATVNAYSAVNNRALDLSWYYREFVSAEIFDNVNYTFPSGNSYPDLLKVTGSEGGTTGSFLAAGTAFTYTSFLGQLIPTSGFVNAAGEADGSGNVLWSIEGISISVTSIYQAAFSVEPDDEQAIIQSILGGDDQFLLSDDGDTVDGFGGDDEIFGRGGDDLLYGSGGEDTLHGEEGNDHLDGGEGIDTAFFDYARADVQVSQAGGTITVTSLIDVDQDTLVDVERLRFFDGTKVFEDSPNADFTYRMYTAAYFRTPDEGGFLYWTDRMDQPDLGGDGVLSYEDKLVLAREFLKADEFQQVYGGPNPTNEHYVELMYENVLKREFDQEGRDYWLGRMEEGAGRDEILTVFVDSLENLANTVADRTDGFWVL